MSKTVLITGASTGIGAASAELLAEDNLIFVHYKSSKEAAEEVGRKVQTCGGEAVLVQADLGSEQGCISLVDQVRQRTDSLDILVNNAGGLIRRQKARDFEWDLIYTVFALNIFSMMKVSGLCIPLLEKRDGSCIINIGSVVARHGAAGATAYAAAKGAVDTFTRGLAKELAPSIRVNAIAPGVIDTPFHEKVSNPEMMKNWAALAPLQKNGKPWHIASAVKFIIENDFLCGECLDINGGAFMR